MIRCNLLCVGEATIRPRGFRNYGAISTDCSVLRRLAGSPALTLLRNLTGGEPKKGEGRGPKWGICHPQTYSFRKKFYCRKNFYFKKFGNMGNFLYIAKVLNSLYGQEE